MAKAIDGEISSIYLGLVVRPYRFVVERRGLHDVIHYDRHCSRTLTQLLISLFDVLNSECDDFAERLVLKDEEIRQTTRQKRRFIARHRSELYPDSPHLEKRSVKFQGHWLATVVGHKEVRALSYRACEVAGIGGKRLETLTL